MREGALRTAVIVGLSLMMACTRGGDPLFEMDPVDEPGVVSVDAGMATDTLSVAAPDDPIFGSVILPIMEAANCTGCHGAAAQSGLSVMSLDDLLAGGTKAGPAIVPCDASASPLTLVLRDQLPGVLAMPLGGSISGSDIETLEAWIDNGADLVACGAPSSGEDAGVVVDDASSLDDASQADQADAGPEDIAEVEDGSGSGGDDVEAPSTFEALIVPILDAFSCSGCHSAAFPSSGLSVASVDGLLVGGDLAGPAILPCDGEASPLVTSIRGELTDIGVSQMPKFGAPMPEEDIAVLVSWIDEGAGVESCGEADDGATATDEFEGDAEDAGPTEPEDTFTDDAAAVDGDIGPEQDDGP